MFIPQATLTVSNISSASLSSNWLKVFASRFLHPWASSAMKLFSTFLKHRVNTPSRQVHTSLYVCSNVWIISCYSYLNWFNLPSFLHSNLQIHLQNSSFGTSQHRVLQIAAPTYTLQSMLKMLLLNLKWCNTSLFSPSSFKWVLVTFKMPQDF